METNYSLANLGKEEKKTSAESRQSWSPYYRSRARDIRVRMTATTWSGQGRSSYVTRGATQWTKTGKWVMASGPTKTGKRWVWVSITNGTTEETHAQGHVVLTTTTVGRECLYVNRARGWSGEGSFLNTLLARASPPGVRLYGISQI